MDKKPFSDLKKAAATLCREYEEELDCIQLQTEIECCKTWAQTIFKNVKALQIPKEIVKWDLFESHISFHHNFFADTFCLPVTIATDENFQ